MRYARTLGYCRFLLARPGAEAWPGTTVDRRWRLPPVSNAARHADEVPQGLAPLPRDLTEEAQLLAAPVMVSIDALLIEDLDEDEDEVFAAALTS